MTANTKCAAMVGLEFWVRFRHPIYADEANKCYTHTWMVYVPGLPRDLDYPEVLGIGVPNPVLVLNNRQDSLFTMPEMQRADGILTGVYKKAGAPERYRASFYDGPHKFDREMQKEGFAWFDRWLKS
jgi:hypothetical protein